MPAKAPTVSILVPAFNGAAFIGECLGSILTQDFEDLEVVVVDDGSSDETVDLVAAIPDPRVRLLRSGGNHGFGANWNRCLREARGTLVKLLPQDDVLAPHCLSRQVAIMQADTGGKLAFTFCARVVTGPTGRTLLRRGWGRGSCVLQRAEVVRRTCRLGTNPIGEPGSVLFRKSAADRAGTFDEQRPFVIDIDYWLRLLEHGDAAYLAEPLCSFRVSRQSWSVRMAGTQTREFIGFLQQLRQRYPSEVSAIAVGAGTLMCRANSWARSVLYRGAIGRSERRPA